MISLRVKCGETWFILMTSLCNNQLVGDGLMNIIVMKMKIMWSKPFWLFNGGTFNIMVNNLLFIFGKICSKIEIKVRIKENDEKNCMFIHIKLYENSFLFEEQFCLMKCTIQGPSIFIFALVLLKNIEYLKVHHTIRTNNGNVHTYSARLYFQESKPFASNIISSKLNYCKLKPLFIEN